MPLLRSLRLRWVMLRRKALDHFLSIALPFSAVRVFGCVLWCFLCLASSHAQSSNTRVEGVVEDQTGSPIARAHVTLKSRTTVFSETTTDADGRFEMEAEPAPDMTLDALASRRIVHHVEAFAAFENLFNQRYTVGLTPVRTIGPPLLMRLGFRLQFGSR